MKHDDDSSLDRRVIMSATEMKVAMREAIREARQDPMASEIALRLANVEAILMKLLQQRGAKLRAGTKRSQSMRARIRNEALAHPERPQDRHYRMVRELMSRR